MAKFKVTIIGSSVSMESIQARDVLDAIVKGLGMYPVEVRVTDGPSPTSFDGIFDSYWYGFSPKQKVYAVESVNPDAFDHCTLSYAENAEEPKTEPRPFKPGDVVRLKSGGPWMTVETVWDDNSLDCVYFTDGVNKAKMQAPGVVFELFEIGTGGAANKAG